MQSENIHICPTNIDRLQKLKKELLGSSRSFPDDPRFRFDVVMSSLDLKGQENDEYTGGNRNGEDWKCEWRKLEL